MKRHASTLQGILLIGFFLLTVLVLFLLIPNSAAGQSLSMSELEQRDGLWYEKDGKTPFSGSIDDPGMGAGTIENGLMIGRWKGRHEDGVPWITDFESGERRYHAMFFDDGQMQFEGWFARNRPDSVWREWAPDGVLVSETHYRNGQRDGISKLWDRQGNLIYQTEYVENKRNGPTIWYYADGQERWTTAYQEGRRSGLWTQWTRDGGIFMQSEWRDDRLVRRNSPLVISH